MEHTDAIALLHRLREVLAAELAQARAERQLLSITDPDSILRRAAEREWFNRNAEGLQRQLAAAVSSACSGRGLPCSISALVRELGTEGDELSSAYAGVSALCAELARTDTLNRALVERTLACINGYLAAVGPRPAYGRRGQLELGPSGATHSQRV